MHCEVLRTNNNVGKIMFLAFSMEGVCLLLKWLAQSSASAVGGRRQDCCNLLLGRADELAGHICEVHLVVTLCLHRSLKPPPPVAGEPSSALLMTQCVPPCLTSICQMMVLMQKEPEGTADLACLTENPLHPWRICGVQYITASLQHAMRLDHGQPQLPLALGTAIAT